LIVRHGESEHNAVLDLHQPILNIQAVSSIRDADVRLTPRGVLQARATGTFLSTTNRLDICFTSPYLRAIQTTEEIVSQLGYPLKVYRSNNLREKEFGRLHGLQEQHVRDKYPEEYTARERDGKYWYRFPGGENYPDVEFRVMTFLEKLSREFAGRSVLIVTHQVPYKMFRAILQHLDEDAVLGLENVANCGVQEYLLDCKKSQDGRLKLQTFNFVAYHQQTISDILQSQGISYQPIAEL